MSGGGGGSGHVVVKQRVVRQINLSIVSPVVLGSEPGTTGWIGAAASSVFTASDSLRCSPGTGARQRSVIASAPLFLSETEAAQVVSLEPEGILVFVGGPWALSVTPEATVSLLVVWLLLLPLVVVVVERVCRWRRKVHDLPEGLGAV